jgi:hypothetical protein
MNTNRVLPLLFGLLVAGCAGASGEDTATGDTSAQAQALGTTGPAFYVDGTLYRTVGTPTELPLSAPDSSFDVIYNLRKAQPYNVATVGPGQPGFNGGRWMVHGISFANYADALAKHDADASGDFDSNEEIEAALAAGDARDIGILKVFECPVIPLSQNE